MEPVIEIRNLSFSYPDGKQALAGINLLVQPGEKVALVGANGAGKSTLLYHLNGIFTGSGMIRVNQLELNKNNLPRVRAMVGLVFQNPDDQLFSPTVYEDVAYGPTYQGFDPHIVREKVALALKAVHMEDYTLRNPYHLSSGEKKRIAIATVLSMQPQILAFDEPTAGLDPRARRELIDLLLELQQTMIIATHDMNMVEQLTPRTVLLNHGKIAADGPSLDILRNDRLLMTNGLI
ncbi:MAG TPA: ABC transporter ATP-binding protein [Anaerolineaceae bacterium]|nr:ABC transporter ATP-binding protein [Anaerolineaceae bacterium]HOQ69759.1 ABC transporter ATP-binding protein [Anaerolineaceae bacterium]HOS53350.1 ABC transporter ATP-binding protein [Anaerolineaceae bacterium]HPD62289.1 ABC transporter ATP-binding protein [Anaerolineaceae bacterium]HQF69126.1 ABC transporter ATP-binding protein [Anaerolineaceae bacterium]